MLMSLVKVRDALLYKSCSFFKIVQKGGGVKPMFKRNCRFFNGLWLRQMIDKKCIPNVQKEGWGWGVKGILNNIKKVSLGNYAVIVLSRDRATEGNLRRK